MSEEGPHFKVLPVSLPSVHPQKTGNSSSFKVVSSWTSVFRGSNPRTNISPFLDTCFTEDLKDFDPDLGL